MEKYLPALRGLGGEQALTLRHLYTHTSGLAAWPACRSENELFLRADAMLYAAKEGGRNQIQPMPQAAARTG